MANILIIDDEPDLRRLLAETLEIQGHHVETADKGSAGLRLREQQEFEVVLLDIRLPDVGGVELTAVLKARYPEVEVVCLTAFGNISDGVRAIKNGAFDYLVKGNDNAKLPDVIGRAAEKARLQYRFSKMVSGVRDQYGFGTITGKSDAILKAVDLGRRVAPTDATVLLTGETGTGKEVFARALHVESRRSAEPFVAVNCSAIGRDILESEMFGYRAGAFTGATRDRKGLFEEADRGTLFLDEVGELSVELQAKLLRVLETGSFIKVGDTKETTVDVRIIAATNRDLQKESETQRFREDLYFRLSTFSIHLPSLEERREDIPLLAEAFLRIFADKMKKRITGMTQEFLDRLIRHYWRGNVRELRNVIERGVILCDEEMLSGEALPADFDNRSPCVAEDKGKSLQLKDAECRHIALVLREAGGNRTRTAKLLGISISTLYAKIREYGL